jgi:hypothetical protein
VRGVATAIWHACRIVSRRRTTEATVSDQAVRLEATDATPTPATTSEDFDGWLSRVLGDLWD